LKESEQRKIDLTIPHTEIHTHTPACFDLIPLLESRKRKLATPPRDLFWGMNNEMKKFLNCPF
jgi:hypothetical protein